MGWSATDTVTLRGFHLLTLGNTKARYPKTANPPATAKILRNIVSVAMSTMGY